MEFDKALYSDMIVNPDTITEGVILIKEGVIVDIVSLESIDPVKITDYSGYAIVPGLIDIHVHVNEPGRTEWEGFETCSRAALAGGITMLVDMPLNCHPVTTSVSALNVKEKEMTEKIYTNVGFHGGIIPSSVNNIKQLHDAGIFAFKIFLIDSGIAEFPEITPDLIHDLMVELHELDAILMIHAELFSPIDIEGNPREYNTYLKSRPRLWENEAIKLLLKEAEATKCRVHIIHLSSSDMIPEIEAARKRGVPVTVETCPHYLFFRSEEIPDGATSFKCAPPIRETPNQQQLWKAIENGIIDLIASDHSPSIPELKELESGNFLEAWGGIASIQFSFSSVWTRAKSHGISINKIIELMSTNPSKFLGLETKGRISKGYDADLAIIDLDGQYDITEEIIEHKHPITPYLGRQLRGIIEETFLDGISVYQRYPKNYSQASGSIIRRD